jgi:hypothetical protein
MRPLFEMLGRWPAWERAAVRHGLAAWVAEELSVRERQVPASLMEAARAQLSTGHKLKRLTLSALDALAQAGVVPVVLKGYGLAKRLFPEQPLSRPAADVDVLVRPEALPAAEVALASLGLRLKTIAGVEDVFEEHHHRPWSGPAGLVELHFRLFSGFGGGVFDDARVWARTTAGELDGREVRWLSPEDEFVYLATHVANHGFLRISWLVDLAHYLTFAPNLDWEVMGARARAAGFEVPLTTALEVLERLLGVELGEAARAAFPRRGRLRRRLDGLVFSEQRVIDARLSADPLASFFLRLYLVDSPVQGGRHVLEGAKRYFRQWRGA